MVNPTPENLNLLTFGAAQFFAISIAIAAMKYSNNFNKINTLFRKMEKIPRSKISTITSGFHEIEGIAHNPAQMEFISPISKKKCLFWSVEIIHLKSDHLEKSLRSDSPFFIKDNSGTILVCPGRFIELQFDPKNTITHEITSEFLREHKEFISKFSLTPSPSTHFIKEIVIDVDKQLYATGNVAKLPGKNQASIARALNRADIQSVRDKLKKLGYNVEAPDTKAQEEENVSVSGQKLVRRSSTEEIRLTWDAKTEGSCHYLYGTPETPIFLSAITETMLENDDYVELYRIPDVATRVRDGSFLLLLFAASIVFFT